MMSELFNERFDRMEKTNIQENGSISVDLFKFSSKLFSLVIMAGFIGKDVMNDKI